MRTTRPTAVTAESHTGRTIADPKALLNKAWGWRASYNQTQTL